MDNNSFSCCDGDKKTLSYNDAVDKIFAKTKELKETEVIYIKDSLGRVLKEDIISPLSHPPKDNSAMDGYAVFYDGTLPKKLKIIGKSFAGHPFKGSIKKDEAVRIMTGAIIPDGTNAVIMQEQIKNHTEGLKEIEITESISQGQNIRLKGEDLKEGSTVLKKGTIINRGTIGLLASMGIDKVVVSRKIKVIIFSTGDELKDITETLSDGDIYDSNRYSLSALLNDPNILIIDKGRLPDNIEKIEEAFFKMKNEADVIISTGGVSVGEADWVKPVISKLGKIIFWKANIKPGRPILFAEIDSTLFFGLPGNPVSVMITFLKFTKVALSKLSGVKETYRPTTVKAKLLCEINKKTGRMEFQRGILSFIEGEPVVSTTGAQGSGILSSMAKANCLITLKEEDSKKNKGDYVVVELIP